MSPQICKSTLQVTVIGFHNVYSNGISAPIVTLGWMRRNRLASLPIYLFRQKVLSFHSLITACLGLDEVLAYEQTKQAGLVSLQGIASFAEPVD